MQGEGRNEKQGKREQMEDEGCTTSKEMKEREYITIVQKPHTYNYIQYFMFWYTLKYEIPDRKLPQGMTD